MFVCETCLDKMKVFAIPFSYGPCEICEKTRPCADVHHSNLPSVDDKEEEEDD